MSDWDHFADRDQAGAWFFSCCNVRRSFREKRIARIRFNGAGERLDGLEHLSFPIGLRRDLARRG
jgi:hypothetical protein